MKTRQEYITILQADAGELLLKFTGIRSMRLFGSVAREQHNDGSDVDVFV